MKLLSLILAFFCLWTAGCNNSGKGSAADKKSDSTTIAVKDNTQLKEPVTPVQPNGLTSETLILKSIDEGAYPLATIHGEKKDGKRDANQQKICADSSNKCKTP